MKNQFSVTLKAVQCDNGGEYLSMEFTGYLKDDGIELQTTAPRSLAQNGIMEWVNRTVNGPSYGAYHRTGTAQVSVAARH